MATWPAEFVIISAYATTGKQWPEARNRRADVELGSLLQCESGWLVRIEGYHPTSGHAEPGWAAEVSLSRACEIGLEFLQDAIFHVKGDILSVVNCRYADMLMNIDSFRRRLDPPMPCSGRLTQ